MWRCRAIRCRMRRGRRHIVCRRNPRGCCSAGNIACSTGRLSPGRLLAAGFLGLAGRSNGNACYRAGRRSTRSRSALRRRWRRLHVKRQCCASGQPRVCAERGRAVRKILVSWMSAERQGVREHIGAAYTHQLQGHFPDSIDPACRYRSDDGKLRWCACGNHRMSLARNRRSYVRMNRLPVFQAAGIDALVERHVNCCMRWQSRTDSVVAGADRAGLLAAVIHGRLGRRRGWASDRTRLCAGVCNWLGLRGLYLAHRGPVKQGRGQKNGCPGKKGHSAASPRSRRDQVG